MHFCFAHVFLAAPLLADLASAQFTDAEGSTMSYPDLESTLPAGLQDACIHRCSLQVASNVTTSCVQTTKKAAAECLCTDPPEVAEMKACFAKTCPPLADRCAAIIMEDGSFSSFQIIPLISTNSTSGSGRNDSSNTSGGDEPSNTGGANNGNTGGDDRDNSSSSIGRSALFVLLSAALGVVML